MFFIFSMLHKNLETKDWTSSREHLVHFYQIASPIESGPALPEDRVEMKKSFLFFPCLTFFKLILNFLCLLYVSNVHLKSQTNPEKSECLRCECKKVEQDAPSGSWLSLIGPINLSCVCLFPSSRSYDHSASLSSTELQSEW